MKRAFDVKLKAVFIIFKGLSAVKNCLRPESAPLIQPAAYSLINAITGKGQEGGFLTLLGKGVKRTRRGSNDMDHMDRSS